MAIDPSLVISPLGCPDCRGPLVVQDDELRCPSCGRMAVMKRGVWDFIDEDDYAGSFGQQWARFSETQLDSRNGTSISRDQFIRVTGWSADQLDGKLVLDGGCGAGRYSEVALAFGARLVAMDLSTAAFIARANLEPAKEVIVVRGNLLQPPLAPGAFDKVVSVGVLQHTPDPLEGARQLMRLVRPGGELVIWMYERRWYTGLLPKFVLRRFTRHLRPSQVTYLTRGLVGAFTPVARLIAKVQNAGLRRGLTTLLPIASYWGSLPLDEKQQREWSMLDTHDWLSPTYDCPQRYSDLARALYEAGAAEVTRRPVPGLTVSATRRPEI